MGGFFIYDSVYGIASVLGKLIDYNKLFKDSVGSIEWEMYLTPKF